MALKIIGTIAMNKRYPAIIAPSGNPISINDYVQVRKDIGRELTKDDLSKRVFRDDETKLHSIETEEQKTVRFGTAL